MKKLFRRTDRVFQIALVALVFMSVILAGAESASRLFADYEKQLEENSQLQAEAILAADPLDPDEGTNGMETKSSPNSEQTACQLSVMPLLNPTADGRGQLIKTKTALISSLRLLDSNRRQCLTSCAQVDTKLAHRLTLVGARPTGTS